MKFLTIPYHQYRNHIHCNINNYTHSDSILLSLLTPHFNRANNSIYPFLYLTGHYYSSLLTVSPLHKNHNSNYHTPRSHHYFGLNFYSSISSSAHQKRLSLKSQSHFLQEKHFYQLENMPTQTRSQQQNTAKREGEDLPSSRSNVESKSTGTTQPVRDTATGMAQSISDTAGKVSNYASESVSNIYNKAQEAATSSLNSAKETASNASNKMQKTHHEAMSTLGSPSVLPETMSKIVPESTINKKDFHKAILDDHKELLSLYDEWCAKCDDAEEAKKWMNQFCWELARHSVGEELILYPLMEEKLGERGLDLAKEARSEHQAAKEDLKALESMTVATPEYNAKVDKLVAELKAHIVKEETVDLPALMDVLSENEKSHYGVLFEKTKKFAPTRPHPSFPDRPPYETAVGLMAAPIDKLMDLFRSFPEPEVVEKVEE